MHSSYTLSISLIKVTFPYLTVNELHLIQSHLKVLIENLVLGLLLKENNPISILEQSSFSVPFVGWLVGWFIGWFSKQFRFSIVRKRA